MPNILIIEDNEQLADLIGQYLQKKGMTVHIAPDGVNALRYFASGSYDLLLVDIRLPQLNGDEVCRKVRESAKGRNIPLIMMSGYVKDPAEIDRLKRDLALAHFLIKPFSSETLFNLMTATLQSATAAPARPAAARPATAQLPGPVKGDLERTPFEQVLLYLFLKRGTGVLAAERDGKARRFTFLDGAAVDVDTAVGDEDFGNYLTRKNLATAAEAQEYEARRKQAGGDPRELFVKMGSLTPQRFQEESMHFLQDRLTECFSWQRGSVLFEWGASVAHSAPGARAFMPVLFYRGFLAHLTPERLRSFMEGKGNLYVGRTAEFFDYRGHLAAEATGAELLDLIDGTRTCSELASVLDIDDAVILLYTLDYLKAVTFLATPQPSTAAPPFPLRPIAVRQAVAEKETFEDLSGELSEIAAGIDSLEDIAVPAGQAAASEAPEALSALEDELREQWESMKGRNYYEIFGMTGKTFSIDKLKKAYFELTKTFGPEKFFASSGEVMSLAEEFLSVVSNAYSTLSNVVTKENYDEALSSQIPTGEEERKFFEKVQFQSGKVMLEQGQYEGAEKAFTNCMTIDPDRAEYLAYLAFAMYHNPATKGDAATVKRAKDMVNKSLLMEKFPIAYALKGTMLFDEGLLNLAEAEFAKALKLNPNNKIALRSMEQIRQKREEEKKGFFQRMFK